jgi:transposase
MNLTPTDDILESQAFLHQLMQELEELRSSTKAMQAKMTEVISAFTILESNHHDLQLRYTALEASHTAILVENADLRSRLKLNSTNSNKPPSSDGLAKKPGLPKEPKKKNGGQPGHTGHTLDMVAVPDVIIVHHATGCTCCDKSFTQADVSEISNRRQVFDIPEPKMEVTEHQIGVVFCCGLEHHGAFPINVGQPVQYGSRTKALCVLLNNDYKVPVEKISQLMRDLYRSSINVSTILSINAKMYEALVPVEKGIIAAIVAALIVHFDETGMRVAKSLHWFHVASTQLFTHLFVHKNRGKEALDSEMSIIKDFKNRAIHDCWASYFDYDCKHGLCGSHGLREFTNLIENKSIWAEQMYSFFMELYKKSEKGTVVLTDQAPWIEEFEKICKLADEEEPPPIKGKRGKPKNSKGRNLLNRLVKHRDEWLAFAFVEAVPFTNNQAERDIRCLKTKQKVATNFQTVKGAEHFARIQGFESTLRKHGMNVYQGLIDVFEGKTIVFKTA